MQLTQAAAHGGLSAKGAATRPGVHWRPRIGTVPEKILLDDADLAISFTVDFPEASGIAGIALGDLIPVSSAAAATYEVIGVTGTDAALINGIYTRSATLYNGAPQWVKGDAVIRLEVDGHWRIYLSGVDHFVGTRYAALPTHAVFTDAGAASSGGDAEVATDTGGESPVLGEDAAEDFEGVALGTLGSIRGIEVHCTAGSGMLVLASGGGAIPLCAGGRFLLALPAEVVEGALVSVVFTAYEDDTAVQITLLGVAA